MRIFIHADKSGTILSAMKVNVLSEGLEHPYGGLAEDDFVIEVDLTSEIAALGSDEICACYNVDPQSRQLKLKNESAS